MKQLFVGQTAAKRRVFSATEVAAYRELTGDKGLDFARHCPQSTVVPGPMLGGLISDLLGTELPGRGTNWLKQRYDFKQPAIIGQEIKAAVEITRLRPEKALVNLAVTISGPSGEILCSGESLVLVKEVDSG
jgi:acyl dehydratase